MDRRKAIRNTGVIAGSAIMLPSLLTLLQSCKEESRLSYTPEFFNEDEAQSISALVDMILPRTSTPGALDANVDMFLDKVIANTYDVAGQGQMRKEIAEFNASCKSTYGNVFYKLSEKDKVACLTEAERTSGKYNGAVWGTAVGKQEPVGFYRSIKSMAIWAYFTSEKIGKEVLSYDPIPGGFLGCIPLADVGNRWTL